MIETNYSINYEKSFIEKNMVIYLFSNEKHKYKRLIEIMKLVFELTDNRCDFHGSIDFAFRNSKEKNIVNNNNKKEDLIICIYMNRRFGVYVHEEVQIDQFSQSDLLEIMTPIYTNYVMRFSKFYIDDFLNIYDNSLL
jgi:hypothetical protein